MVRTGIVTSDSTPPDLLLLEELAASYELFAFSRFSSSRYTTPPKLCNLQSARFSVHQRRIRDLRTFGLFERKTATSSPFLICSSILGPRVFTPTTDQKSIKWSSIRAQPNHFLSNKLLRIAFAEGGKARNDIGMAIHILRQLWISTSAPCSSGLKL
jgi:hypothetical protein